MQAIDWFALFLSGSGIAAPIAVFSRLAARYGDKLWWQEGIGFYTFCACLLTTLVCEIVALCLGKRAGGTTPGVLAIWVSVLVLIGVVAVIAYVLWDMLPYSWKH